MERREFIILAGATAIDAPSSSLLAALVPSAPPAKVTAAEISRIRQAAQLFRGLDHAYGGALAIACRVCAHRRQDLEEVTEGRHEDEAGGVVLRDGLPA